MSLPPTTSVMLTGDGLGDTDALGDRDGDALSDGLIEADGLIDADGLMEGDSLSDGLMEADGLMEGDGLREADGDKLGDSEADRLTLALGLTDGDALALGLLETLGDTDGLGETDALGDSDGLALADGDMNDALISAARPPQLDEVVHDAEAVVSNASLRHWVLSPRTGSAPARSSASVQFVRGSVTSLAICTKQDMGRFAALPAAASGTLNDVSMVSSKTAWTMAPKTPPDKSAPVTSKKLAMQHSCVCASKSSVVTPVVLPVASATYKNSPCTVSHSKADLFT